MEHEGKIYANCDWCLWHGNKRIITGPGRFGSWRPSGDHLNNSIIENGQNTEKRLPAKYWSLTSRKTTE